MLTRTLDPQSAEDHPPGGVPLRDLPRLGAIARVAAAHGWRHYVERLGLGRFAPGTAQPAGAGTDAQQLREALEELGPTFVKFGQMLATRRDVLPEALVSELAQLRSQVVPFEGRAARAIVERELGASIERLFASFDEEPFAAASIAQVHRATLADGSRVVVKVQRPGIDETIAADLTLLRHVARLLDRHVDSVRGYNLPVLVEEFAAMITHELDFAHEAANAERFARANAGEAAVWVPPVVWPLSSRRVLTMAHSTGCAIDAEHPADRALRRRLAADLLRLFLTQVLEHGVFHADPHAGNVFVLDDGRLCFHDFGALGVLDARDRDNLRHLFLAVIARDPDWLADTYLAMGGVEGPVDRAAFVRDIDQALDTYYAAGAGHSFGAVLGEFVRLGRKHHVRLVREGALVARAFMTVESLARELDPEFDAIEAFRAYSGRLVATLLAPETGDAALARTYRSLGAARSALMELPIAARRLLDQFGGEGPVLRVRHEQLGGGVGELTRAANRIAFALIVSAIVIGASVVLTAHAGAHVFDLPLLAVAGFALAAVLGLGWAWATARSTRVARRTPRDADRGAARP
ncbi:AarF/ABC1/UbiB kinase family protein [Betaproteobacteria bacterium PRO7]|jgi:ubiquinone biosynthesis protein|nr:AarF/ABC1/UbiB kinase family protein [Betaproteobacteria bacterium PRO7]